MEAIGWYKDPKDGLWYDGKDKKKDNGVAKKKDAKKIAAATTGGNGKGNPSADPKNVPKPKPGAKDTKPKNDGKGLNRFGYPGPPKQKDIDAEKAKA